MRKSRLSQQKQTKLMEHFIAGTTARCVAEIVGVNRNIAIYYYHRLHLLIFAYHKQFEAKLFDGKIEVDKSYFGGIRKGKRGQGSTGKIPVFGLLENREKVYTKVIPNAKSETLIPIIEGKVIPDHIVYSDSFKSYNVLDVSEFKHYRINHNKRFAKSHNHINGIENF